MRQFGEEQAAQAEGDARDGHLSQQDGIDVEGRDARLRVPGKAEVIRDMCHAPGMAGVVGHDSRQNCRDERGVFDPPDGQHLEGEDRARDGRAEDGAEARGDAHHQ